jgi:predicted outer membrane protein
MRRTTLPPTKRSRDVQDTPYFINNKFVKSEATQFIELHDPATNNLVTRVPQSTDAELKAAVESAQEGFPSVEGHKHNGQAADYVQVYTVGSGQLGQTGG